MGCAGAARSNCLGEPRALVPAAAFLPLTRALSARPRSLRQAPEVLAGGPATAASDVFSLGVVLWEVGG